MKTVGSQLKGWVINSRYLKAAGVVMLGVLVSVACTSTPKTRYYTLRLSPPPRAQSPKTHFVLQVEPFEAPDLLQDNRMLYYTSPNELNFHEYHRWASQPGELLRNMAMQYLADTGLFKQVYTYPAPVDADFTLRGRLLDLGEMQYQKRGKHGEARIAMDLELLQAHGSKVVWSARLEETAPVEKKKVESFVEAMNVAAKRLLQQAYAGISQVVEQEAAQQKQQAH